MQNKIHILNFIQYVHTSFVLPQWKMVVLIITISYIVITDLMKSYPWFRSPRSKFEELPITLLLFPPAQVCVWWIFITNSDWSYHINRCWGNYWSFLQMQILVCHSIMTQQKPQMFCCWHNITRNFCMFCTDSILGYSQSHGLSNLK